MKTVRFSSVLRGFGPRAAIAQPRLLVLGMVAAVGGLIFLGAAQNGPPEGGQGLGKRSVSLNDIAGLVENYGKARAQKARYASLRAASGRSGAKFRLTEGDLTPTTASDEVEPAFSPNGKTIAFASTGVDANNDKILDATGKSTDAKYHIWIMNRDGSNVRQVTGVTSVGGLGRDQRRPAWSPDGATLVFVDGTGNSGQLGTAPATKGATISRLTNFSGTKREPNWGQSGQIAFACNFNPISTSSNPNGVALTNFDIFSVDADADPSSLRRLTGRQNDTIGQAVDDTAPAFSLVYPSLVYFTSARETNSAGNEKATTGGQTRIWVLDTATDRRFQVTDPASRVGYQPTDIIKDDFVTPSITAEGTGVGGQTQLFAEHLAFQTNSRIDASDTNLDTNIWSLTVDSDEFRPTPTPFPTPKAAITVGSFGGGPTNANGSVRSYDFPNPAGNQPSLLGSTEGDPILTEGVTYSGFQKANGSYKWANLVGGAYPDILVSNRAQGKIEVYNGATGIVFRGYKDPFGRSVDYITGLSQPTDSIVTSDGNGGFYLYVSSGSSAKIYRFQFGDDIVAGAEPKLGDTDEVNVDRQVIGRVGAYGAGFDETQTVFTSFPPGGTGLSGGFEGLAFGPDGNLYASAVGSDKVVCFDGQSGAFKSFYVWDDPETKDDPKTPKVNENIDESFGLKLPTGLAFGPDQDGDGIQDLYVSSSGTDDVKVYHGPDASRNDGSKNGGGAGIDFGGKRSNNYVDHTVNEGGLKGPEGLLFTTIKKSDGTITKVLLVSSFNSVTNPGKIVLKYTATQGGPTSGGQVFITDQLLTGPGYLALNPTHLGFVLPPSVAPKITVAESQGEAELESNPNSSPAGIKPGGTALYSQISEDRAADKTPTFSRSQAQPSETALIAFSSNRLVTPRPGGGGTGQPDMGGTTSDIWSTAVQDYTPPTLVPQSFGNQQFPVVSPGPQAPTSAGRKRTPETGLVAGEDGKFHVKVAVVLKEQDSGLLTGVKSGSVKAIVRDALLPQFSGYPDRNTITPNYQDHNGKNSQTTGYRGFSESGFGSVVLSYVNGDNVVRIAPEDVAASVDFSDSQPAFLMDVYDDGPAPAGHELQAGAVKGDGFYYCTVDVAVSKASDYFIDIEAQDSAKDTASIKDDPFDQVRDNTAGYGVGNFIRYDHIWGFSTLPFERSSESSDLLVSDYGAGQLFPHILTGGEYQFLDNLGKASKAQYKSPFPHFRGGNSRFRYMTPIESYYLNNPGGDIIDKLNGTVVGQSEHKTTFDHADTWRILSRGPVPGSVLKSYAPKIETQFDPKKFQDGVPEEPVADRNVTVSKGAVIWASPYTGSVFAGPGTLADAQTQNRLTAFTQSGGRLMVAGRDVVFSLANPVTGSPSTFLRDQLRAKFSKETRGSVLTEAPGKFTIFSSGDDIQLAEHLGTYSASDRYTDAAPNRSAGFDPSSMIQSEQLFYDFKPIDTFTSVDGSNSAGNPVEITPAYTLGGENVSQRIRQVWGNGAISKTVLFSFGFEGINRRYTGSGNSAVCVDQRYNIGRGVLYWFKTAGVTGEVRNKDTNTLLRNFYVQVTSEDGLQKYLTRTNDDGIYTINGFELAGQVNQSVSLGTQFTVQPAVDKNGNPLNPGFAVGTKDDTVERVIFEPGTQDGVDLRVTPLPSGAISGQVESNGVKISNLPVLIKSIDDLPTSRFPDGGRFAQIVLTNPQGVFTASDLPAVFATAGLPTAGSDIKYQVIFNPDPRFESDGGDIPDDAILDYGPGKTVQQAPYGRLAVPEKAEDSVISAPSGGTYYLDNVGGDDASHVADGTPDVSQEGFVPFDLSQGVKVSGGVKVNGSAASGVTVTLLQGTDTIDTTTTDANGIYTFDEVEPGDYTVSVTRSTTKTKDITVGTQAVTVPDFSFNEPQLSGTVLLNGSAAAASGATVELLKGNGASMTPPVTATADANGKYSFGVELNKSYQLRASKAGDTSAIVSVTVSQNAQTAANLKLFLQTVTGFVRLSSSGQPAASAATVDLVQNGTVLQSVIAGQDGSYTFTVVAAGTYVIRASRSNVSGQVTVVVPRDGSTVTAPDIILQGASTQPGTSFSDSSRTYAISVPYEDTNAPKTNNRADLSPRTNVGAYSVLASAFMPVKSNGDMNYVLQRYNSETRQLEGYNATSNPFTIRRGEGYLLKILASSDPTNPNGTALKIPPVADNPAYVALQSTVTNFTYVLRKNPSFSGEPNGTNLIGFPFNPNKVAQVSWLDASVYNPMTLETVTMAQAVSNGWVSGQLTTLDPTSGSSTQVTTMFPYGAYYAKTTVNGLEITVKAP